MVRLYVDLGVIDPNHRDAFRGNTQDRVIAIAQRPLDAHDELAAFFGRFLLDRR